MTTIDDLTLDGSTRTLPPDSVLEHFRSPRLDRRRDQHLPRGGSRRAARDRLPGAVVPEQFGGWGLDLAEFSALQRRLARYAPATALCMTMHSYWVGIAVELERWGDTSCRFLFDEALAGRIIGAGHAEAGNDVPVALSTTTATRVEGGYRFSGHKLFGSNGPAWQVLGIHGIDLSDPAAPVIVHGFVDRDAEGVTVVPRWDTLGMRPTQSYETVLDEAYVPDARIGRITRRAPMRTCSSSA